MKDKASFNKIENDKFTLNINENDYKSLITRLREISLIISSLEKQYLDKF